MSKRLTPPLKWHGGKHYLAKRIVDLMPPHIHYVEPFAGGLSVLLAKDPQGVSEVVNDLNGELANFWRVLQSPIHFEKFRRLIEAVPFAEFEWEAAGRKIEQLAATFAPDRIPDGVDTYKRAAWFFIRCRQSLAGRMKAFTGITKTRTRRGMNNEVSAWLTAVEGLPAVHARLKRVLILNRPALEVIRSQDGPDTLQYLDPPYLHETRATTDDYAHEMDEPAHEALLMALGGLKGKAMISGYRSDLYDSALRGWTRHDFEISNHAAGGRTKRRMTECLWTNF